MKSEMEESVRRLISEQCCIKEKHLPMSARLEEDLGVTGDDAVELMQAFFSAFNVDPANIMLGKYFGPEAVFALGPPELGKYPVTVGHLVAVAEHGRWFLPPRADT